MKDFRYSDWLEGAGLQTIEKVDVNKGVGLRRRKPATNDEYQPSGDPKLDRAVHAWNAKIDRGYKPKDEGAAFEAHLRRYKFDKAASSNRVAKGWKRNLAVGAGIAAAGASAASGYKTGRSVGQAARYNSFGKPQGEFNADRKKVSVKPFTPRRAGFNVGVRQGMGSATR